jgi:steroid 5-alpha reductase family enzyme
VVVVGIVDVVGVVVVVVGVVVVVISDASQYKHVPNSLFFEV